MSWIGTVLAILLLGVLGAALQNVLEGVDLPGWVAWPFVILMGILLVLLVALGTVGSRARALRREARDRRRKLSDFELDGRT